MDALSAVFVSDIDGTLVQSGHAVHDDVLKMLLQFRTIGNFTLSTGRGIESTLELARHLGVDIPCIMYGGAMIYDTINMKTLFVMPMVREITTVLKRLMDNEEGLSITVYTEKYTVNLCCNSTLALRGVLQDKTAPMASLSDINSDIIKVLLTHEDSDTLKRIQSSYFNRNIFNCTAASRHFYEVTSRSVNKGRALSILCEMLGYASRYKFAAGDGDTDISMKQLTQRFYVPCTAQQHILEQANIVIPSPKDGGIAVALEDAIAMCTNKLTMVI